MDKQSLDDQPEPIYNSSVPIEDITWKTFRLRWTIETGRERESGISVQVARHDDDDTFKKKRNLKENVSFKELNVFF